MVIEMRHQADVTILEIEGLVKLGHSAEFLKKSVEAKLAEEKLVVDLEKVDYLDSTGIGELVQVLANLANSGVRLVLVSDSERIRKLIKLARFGALLPTFESREKAVASFHAKTNV